MRMFQKPWALALASVLAVSPMTRADEPDNSVAYQQVVGSVVYIKAIDRNWNFYSGTGVIVNAERSEILTAFHVIEPNCLCAAMPPIRDKDGDIVTDPNRYSDIDESTRCVVLALDEGRDLALIRWKKPRTGLKAIPVAAKSASPGTSVFCIGNGASMRFRYSGGSVRQLANESYTTSANQKISARILTTSCPIDGGDSGSPLVSRNGELLGIVSSTRTGLNQIHQSIDLSEIRHVLDWWEGVREKKP
jgi:S1-C subfamily serine protease